LLEELDKHILHKNLKVFFGFFPHTTFKNTLLIDDTPHKSMFNPPCSAIFFKTFYGSLINGNYLLGTIFPYLELLDSSRMQVYKFVELNALGNITNVPPDDPQYEKLNGFFLVKCDETFCNKVKSRFVNKKVETFITLLLNYYALIV
jgi:hypothetical protein